MRKSIMYLKAFQPRDNLVTLTLSSKLTHINVKAIYRLLKLAELADRILLRGVSNSVLESSFCENLHVNTSVFLMLMSVLRNVEMDVEQICGKVLRVLFFATSISTLTSIGFSNSSSCSDTLTLAVLP